MTSRFSELFGKYIDRCGLTENQLARISGFTRSYIALMRNGQRVSSDQVRMERLLEGLKLPLYEYDELWQEYLKARYGSEKYQLMQEMVAFVESFATIPEMLISSAGTHTIPETRCVGSRLDLEALIKSVIENESGRENGWLKMVMQPELDFIYSLLPCILRDTGSLQVEHIICLESNSGGDEKGQFFNLRFFRKLIPVILSDRRRRYSVFYHYDRTRSHFSSTAMMPYLLITSQYVILISSDMNSGLVSKEPEVIAYFRDRFDAIRRECRPMLRRFENSLDMFWRRGGEGEGMINTLDALRFISSQPCFGLLPMVESLVPRYIRPEYAGHAPWIRNMIQSNRQFVKQEKIPIVVYFAMSGLERFLEEGRIDEIPMEIYRPLDMEHRKKLLHMLLSAIRDEYYEAYMIDEQRMVFPRELVLSANGMTDVDICFVSEDADCKFILEEQGLSRMVYDFLGDFRDSVYVMSRKDTIARLEDLLKGV